MAAWILLYAALVGLYVAVTVRAARIGRWIGRMTTTHAPKEQP